MFPWIKGEPEIGKREVVLIQCSALKTLELTRAGRSNTKRRFKLTQKMQTRES